MRKLTGVFGAYLIAILFGAILVTIPAQAGTQAKLAHGRGHILPSKEVSARLHAISNARYGHILRALPPATQPSYDAYTATGGSCIPPIGNQGQCGNCYWWSGMKVCSAAQMTAGVVPKGSKFMLSVQWGLDTLPQLGGCDGGDEYQVAQAVQSGGAPSLSQYPGAGQQPGNPQPITGMTLYSISSIVYCDPTQTDQGVASTQSIKNCILAYSYVSVAVAAGSDWDAYAGGTLTGKNRQINHAVGATGWDDNHDNGDGTKGAFLGDNQWGENWGNVGRFWIKYGADSYGTESFVTLVNAPPPPPVPPTPIPPTPVPPTPVPPTPVPPTPVPPTPTAPVTITTSGPLPAGMYQLDPVGTIPLPVGMVAIGPGTTLSDLGTILQGFAGKPVPPVSVPIPQSIPQMMQSGAAGCASEQQMQPQRRGFFGRWK